MVVAATLILHQPGVKTIFTVSLTKTLLCRKCDKLLLIHLPTILFYTGDWNPSGLILILYVMSCLLESNYLVLTGSQRPKILW